MLRYHIIMDFCDDYSRLVRYWMQKQGLQSNKDGWDLWYEYFNFQKKNIIPRKRKVWKSKEFFCPQEFEKGLEMLIQKFERGENVSGHLSKMAKDPSKFDDLLYDWGIYHFHLGERSNPKTGYIERTGPLLFARVDEENVYLINIFKHGEWTKQEMLRIIHQNWPQIVEQYKLPEVWSTTQFTDEEYAAVRRSHATALVEVEKNAVYGLLGGGYMSSGHSAEIASHCDSIYNWFKELESAIKKELHRIIKYIEVCTGITPDYNLHFMLWSIKNEIHIVELHSHVDLVRLQF